MHTDLENQIEEIINNYCEAKKLDQSTKDFIIKLVESVSKKSS